MLARFVKIWQILTRCNVDVTKKVASGVYRHDCLYSVLKAQERVHRPDVPRAPRQLRVPLVDLGRDSAWQSVPDSEEDLLTRTVK